MTWHQSNIFVTSNKKCTCVSKFLILLKQNTLFDETVYSILQLSTWTSTVNNTKKPAWLWGLYFVIYVLDVYISLKSTSGWQPLLNIPYHISYFSYLKICSILFFILIPTFAHKFSFLHLDWHFKHYPKSLNKINISVNFSLPLRHIHYI